MTKKLIVFLTCQRSGSSVTAELFHHFGMSLGTYRFHEQTNQRPLGCLEALSVVQIDQELHRLIYGFGEDALGHTPGHKYVPDYKRIGAIMKNRDGLRPDLSQISPHLIQRGEKTVRTMLGRPETTHYGVKHPAMCLFWFYWQHVFSRIPDLEIHPVFLLRSPSGIAASYARRATVPKVEHDMYDLIEVCLRRQMEIYWGWQGRKNIIRFDDKHYVNDLKRAIGDCGLVWNAETFLSVFQREKTMAIDYPVDHPVQEVYDRWLQLARSKK